MEAKHGKKKSTSRGIQLSALKTSEEMQLEKEPIKVRETGHKYSCICSMAN